MTGVEGDDEMVGSTPHARDSGRIGVIMPEFASPFFSEITDAIQRRASVEGWAISASDTMDDPDREAAQIEAAVRAGVAGLLLVPAFSRVPVDALRTAGLPTVLIGTGTPFDEWSSVRPDDELGGWMAARHLLDGGRRRVLFVGGPADAPFVTDRLRGARRAVAEFDGARLLVMTTDHVTVREGRDIGQRIVQLQRRPDAVFAANDMIAIGVLQGASVQGGITVPGELAICGFDGIRPTATQSVPLTTLDQPRTRIGTAAVELLLAAVAGEPNQAVVLPPVLVRRASTAAAAAA